MAGARANFCRTLPIAGQAGVRDSDSWRYAQCPDLAGFSKGGHFGRGFKTLKLNIHRCACCRDMRLSTQFLNE